MLAQARACSDEGVVVALFPELHLSGYSIEDLLMQDAVLDAVEAALATVVEGSRELLPCSSSAHRCSTATASTTARS